MLWFLAINWLLLSTKGGKLITKTHVDTWNKVGILQNLENPNLFCHKLDNSVEVDLSETSIEGAVYMFIKKSYELGYSNCQKDVRKSLGLE